MSQPFWQTHQRLNWIVAFICDNIITIIGKVFNKIDEMNICAFK